MENSESTPTPAPKKSSSKGKIPAKDIERSNLGVTVATNWGTKPTITLEYITQPAFLVIATEHQQAVKNRLDASKTRPQMTQKMEALDKVFNTRTTNVKNYLSDKYENKENAQSYYAEFGIIKKGDGWVLPADRDQRVLSLAKLLTALTTHGFQNNTYGKAWWTTRIAEYTALVKTAGETDSNTSDMVGAKNTHKETVIEVLNSLIFIIKGNYPKTWKTVLRAWGFQKEKF